MLAITNKTEVSLQTNRACFAGVIDHVNYGLTKAFRYVSLIDSVILLSHPIRAAGGTEIYLQHSQRTSSFKNVTFYCNEETKNAYPFKHALNRLNLLTKGYLASA